MKRLYLLLVTVVSALLLTGCGAGGIASVTLVTQGAHTIAPGETLRGELVIMGGETVVREDARIAGSVYLLDGALDIEGEVGGDVSVIGGTLSLGSEAAIGGDLNFGGGQLEQAPGAVIVGVENRGTGITVPSGSAQTVRSILSSTGVAFINALLLALLAALAASLLPRPIDRVSHAAVRYPLVSGALGLLAGIVIPSLLVLMVFTIVLIPVALLGALLFTAALAYGWIVIGVLVGKHILHILKRRTHPALAAFLGTLLLSLAMDALNLVPVVGPLIPLLVVVIGFGAVMLTRFGLRTYVSPQETLWEGAAASTESQRHGVSM